MSVKFEDYSIQVINTINRLASSVLEESAGELESQIKRNNVVDTGKTKNSWMHRVSSTGDEHIATVGSTEQNAIWEEYGTGEYALNGNGRKGGWFYRDEQGHGHFTHGKHARRPAFNAYSALRDKLIKHMQDTFKRGLSS